MGSKVSFTLFFPKSISNQLFWAADCLAQAIDARHNTQYIVRMGKDPQLIVGIQEVQVRETSIERLIGEPQVELGVVDTRQVGRARGLVLLRVNGEGVDIDTILGCVGVVLVGLNVVEVRAFTDVKAVMTVELDQSLLNSIASTIDQQTKVERLVQADIVILGATSISHAVDRE